MTISGSGIWGDFLPSFRLLTSKTAYNLKSQCGSDIEQQNLIIVNSLTLTLRQAALPTQATLAWQSIKCYPLKW